MKRICRRWLLQRFVLFCFNDYVANEVPVYVPLTMNLVASQFMWQYYPLGGSFNWKISSWKMVLYMKLA